MATPQRKALLLRNVIKVSALLNQKVIPVQFWAGRRLGNSKIVEVGRLKSKWDPREGFKSTMLWIMPYESWLDIFKVTITPGQAVFAALLMDYERGSGECKATGTEKKRVAKRRN